MKPSDKAPEIETKEVAMTKKQREISKNIAKIKSQMGRLAPNSATQKRPTVKPTYIYELYDWAVIAWAIWMLDIALILTS